ncbi:MAG: uracil-DNA glycosylase family protein [Pseudomonadota bacterium]
MGQGSDLSVLASDVRSCRLCEAELPLDPRPVIQVHEDSRVLIAGQAPGRRVHESGRPFNDPSGVRLRRWLGVDEKTFYDPSCFALLPMGFCFPGTSKGGDLPPRKECAEAWRQPLLNCLSSIRVTLLLGRYALAWHLPEAQGTLSEIVEAWREHAPKVFVAPHPSPRNQRWLRNNPGFERDTVPALQKAVAGALRN